MGLQRCHSDKASSFYGAPQGTVLPPSPPLQGCGGRLYPLLRAELCPAGGGQEEGLNSSDSCFQDVRAGQAPPGSTWTPGWSGLRKRHHKCLSLFSPTEVLQHLLDDAEDVLGVNMC